LRRRLAPLVAASETQRLRQPRSSPSIPRHWSISGSRWSERRDRRPVLPGLSSSPRTASSFEPGMWVDSFIQSFMIYSGSGLCEQSAPHRNLQIVAGSGMRACQALQIYQYYTKPSGQSTSPNGDLSTHKVYLLRKPHPDSSGSVGKRRSKSRQEDKETGHSTLPLEVWMAEESHPEYRRNGCQDIHLSAVAGYRSKGSDGGSAIGQSMVQLRMTARERTGILAATQSGMTGSGL